MTNFGYLVLVATAYAAPHVPKDMGMSIATGLIILAFLVRLIEYRNK